MNVQDIAKPVASTTDRRRPGRAEANPALVPLLRGKAEPAPPPEEEEGNAIRGIGVALLLAIPLWAAIFFAGRAIWSAMFD